MRNPIMKKQLLTTKINFSSFANPAATMPASHPKAWNDITDATLDFPFPASYAYANIGGIIIPDAIPAPNLAMIKYVVLSAK